MFHGLTARSPREGSFPVADEGEYRIAVYVGRGARATEVRGTAPETIQVRDELAPQIFEIRVPPEAMARALRRLGRERR